jgi:hypothetical protein
VLAERAESLGVHLSDNAGGSFVPAKEQRV